MSKVAKKILIIVLKIISALALAFLVLLITGFLAVYFNLTKTAGDVDENTGIYNSLENSLTASRQIMSFLPGSRDVAKINEAKVYCKLYILSDYADYNAKTILTAYQKNKSYELAEKMILALELRLQDKPELGSRLSFCSQDKAPEISLDWLNQRLSNPKDANVFLWQTEEPWQIIRQAVIKDKDSLNRVGQELNISPRLLLSVAIVEQLRLYYTQRELFERVFKPLKILASANKMAWGVMSIKEAAAILAEQNLKNKNSDFYLGANYEKLLDFSSNNPVTERYARLTDEKNHYFSYLYGGVIIKQITSQWQKAGYNISDRPEILATLFNIGVQNSHPKANPEVGGSQISIGQDTYVFGSLAYEFYYSGDLMDDFSY
ncbi:MAG: hypothetical protein WCK59_03690 [Candidatus Falkowbacteria bacterium]